MVYIDQFGTSWKLGMGRILLSLLQYKIGSLLGKRDSRNCGHLLNVFDPGIYSWKTYQEFFFAENKRINFVQWAKTSWLLPFRFQCKLVKHRVSHLTRIRIRYSTKIPNLSKGKEGYFGIKEAHTINQKLNSGNYCCKFIFFIEKLQMRPYLL